MGVLLSSYRRLYVTISGLGVLQLVQLILAQDEHGLELSELCVKLTDA